VNSTHHAAVLEGIHKIQTAEERALMEAAAPVHRSVALEGDLAPTGTGPAALEGDLGSPRRHLTVQKRQLQPSTISRPLKGNFQPTQNTETDKQQEAAPKEGEVSLR
jgi:hypothetical protein